MRRRRKGLCLNCVAAPFTFAFQLVRLNDRMKRLQIANVLLLLVFCLCPLHAKDDWRSDERNEDILLDHLRVVLKSFRGGIRV